MQARFNNSNYVNKKMCTLFFSPKSIGRPQEVIEGNFVNIAISSQCYYCVRKSRQKQMNVMIGEMNWMTVLPKVKTNRQLLIVFNSSACVRACVYCVHLWARWRGGYHNVFSLFLIWSQKCNWNMLFLSKWLRMYLLQ